MMSAMGLSVTCLNASFSPVSSVAANGTQCIMLAGCIYPSFIYLFIFIFIFIFTCDEDIGVQLDDVCFCLEILCFIFIFLFLASSQVIDLYFIFIFLFQASSQVIDQSSDLIYVFSVSEHCMLSLNSLSFSLPLLIFPIFCQSVHWQMSFQSFHSFNFEGTEK